jgi:hypothetical protein
MSWSKSITMALLAETSSQGTDGPWAVRRPAFNPQQIRCMGNAGLTSAMKTPCRILLSGLPLPILSNGSLRDVISNAPAPK